MSSAAGVKWSGVKAYCSMYLRKANLISHSANNEAEKNFGKKLKEHEALKTTIEEKQPKNIAKAFGEAFKSAHQQVIIKQEHAAKEKQRVPAKNGKYDSISPSHPSSTRSNSLGHVDDRGNISV